MVCDMETNPSILNRDIAATFPWAEPLSAYCHSILGNLGWSTRVVNRNMVPGLDSVLLASPQSGQGVTTIAATMALMAARDPFCRVLYLDFSFRPQARTLFNSTPHQDPPSILFGRHLEQTSLASLDYLWVAGAKAIRSHSRRKLALEQAWNAYDLVIIDWPPNMTKAWLEHVAPVANVALIVAGRESTKSSVNQLAKTLMGHGLSNVGVVFNQDGPQPNQPNLSEFQ